MSDSLNLKQITAAQLLAAGETVRFAATQLKVREETITRWKRNPAFCAEVERTVRQMQAGLRDRLVRLADRSLDAIEQELAHCEESVRGRRAMNVLSMLGMSNFLLPPEK